MFIKLIFPALFILALASCKGTGQLFQSKDTQADPRAVLQQYFQTGEPKIQPGDKIAVSIWGHEDLSVGSVSSSYSTNEASGKWLVVDNDGEVNLPQIGRVKVAGYDLKEINFLLESKYAALIKAPIINVKVLNHYVTVLGEVNAPGKYPLNNEQVTLIGMLGEARGLSNYARPSHVRVIRTVDNRSVELQVDLTDLSVIPEFNVILQPDDIVYVGANQKKGADDRLRRATTISSILTGVAVIATFFLK